MCLTLKWRGSSEADASKWKREALNWNLKFGDEARDMELEQLFCGDRIASNPC